MAGWREAIGTPDNQEAPASSGGWRDAIGVSGNEQMKQQSQDNRRWEQKFSDFVTDNTPSYPSGPDMSPIQPQGSGPVSMALSAAGQTVGVQPTAAKTPQGAALETIQNQVMAPARLSNTAGAAVEPTENATVDYLGKKNVNPYLSAGIGMLAGAATDPRNYIPLRGENASLESELPVIQGSKTGTPHAAFDYNDPITGKSSYQIFGDPAKHGYSTTPNVPYETLQQKGIPVVGKTQKAAQLGHEPLDTLPRQATPQPGFFAKRTGVSLPQSSELSKSIAESREARTGVPARDFQALSRDPGAYWAKGDTAEAGEAIGRAKVGSDINMGVQHGDLSTLTPENIQMARAPRVVGKEALESITDDLSAAKQLLPDGPAEQQIALANIHPDTVNKALVESNSRLSKLIPGTEQYRAESAIKSNLQTILQNVAPEVKAANAKFARLSLRDKFSGAEAVTKAGKPSKLAMLAKKIPAAVGGMVGGSLFGTPGAIGGYELGGDLANLYHSPRIAGLQTAIGSMINKAGSPIVSGAEKTITSPAAMAYLSRYLSRKNQGNTK